MTAIKGGIKMKRNNKKASDTNPYKKEYGTASNIGYVLGKAVKYSKKLPFLMLVTVVSNVIMNYIGSFIGKYVIDIAEIQVKNEVKDFAPLIGTLAVFAAIELLSRLANRYGTAHGDMEYMLVRLKVIGERVEKSLSLDYQSLEKPVILDMDDRAGNAVGGNENGFEGMLRNIGRLAQHILAAAFAFAAVIILDIRLILVLTLICLVQYFFFVHTVKKDKKEVWDKLSPEWRKTIYMERTTQDFDCAKDIRLFGMKDWLTDKQKEIHKSQLEKIFHSKNLWIKNTVFSNCFRMVSDAAVYAVLIFCVLRRDMSIGDFTLYLGLTAGFSSALNQLLQTFGNIKKQSLELDDFRSFMDLPNEENENYLPLPETEDYKFEFRNVSFKYYGSENYALKNINLTLEPHKKLAVVGLNGAGKTTLIKLLLRLYDTDEGEILLNGTNIKRFNREEYFELFSPVFQNVELFAFPYCENVAMKPSAELDREKIQKVSEQAGLSEKLLKMPQGIDTELLKIKSEDGIDFSGGERQKLALARALYKNAPIIVLDEPTAALDALAEYRLYKAFDEIIGNKTAVYISHRLSSTRFCDGIACFNNGEMVEYGTHEELLKKDGVYAEMFRVQSQYYKESEGENLYA